MRYSPTAVQVERVGPFVEIVVGKSTVRMTTVQAEQVVQAIERAIEEAPKAKATVH
jgi:hypothetical protein